MNESGILPGPVWTGIIMSVVLVLLFLFQERYKVRKKRVMYADLIMVELKHILNFLQPPSWGRPILRTNHPIGTIPRSMYDGLVSSSMISVLSTDLQRQLYTFYRGIDSRQYASLQSEIIPLLEDVNKFKEQNRRRRKWLTA